MQSSKYPRTLHLRLKDGRRLHEDATLDVISRITPFYASVPQVMLEGGMWLRKLQPFTVASKIYEASGEADLIVPRGHVRPGNHQEWYRFVACRNHYVKAMVAVP